MSFINVQDISKTFKVAKRRSGLKATLKSFFKRNYIYVEAVKDISFQIEKGEIVGYIGPNGAGKSTTIKILSGILVPDSGKCTINGLVPYKDRQNMLKILELSLVKEVNYGGIYQQKIHSIYLKIFII